jgi:zinc protease
MRRWVGLGLALALVAAPAGVRAQAPAVTGAGAAGADTLPRDPAVRAGTLANGLRYVVRENRRPERRAELRLVVDAGSVLEDEDQRGLAHFVEHMAFNGTENFEKQEIVSYLESIGMRFGADLNAYTSFDETVYMLTVPTDAPEPLATGLRILEEWAHRVTFDAAEIEKERGVVIEEWRLGQGAQARLRDRTFPVLFRGSRYAERLPIGDRRVLETFDRETLVRFYRDWYRPDLMGIVAVGDFDGADVERQIVARFSGIPSRSDVRPRPRFDVPDHDEPLVVRATDPEMTATIVRAYFKHDVREGASHAAYRRTLVETLYDRMFGARLTELTQRADPPFVAAFAGQGRLIRTKEAYTVAALVADGGVERGLDALLTEVERVARHGFTVSELERAKADVLRMYEEMYDERETTNSATFANEYVRHLLEDEPIPGIAYELQLAREMLPGIALGEVNELAVRVMASGNRVIVAEAPDRDGSLPPADRLLAAFDAVRARAIEPWADDVVDSPLVAVPPVPGVLATASAIDEVGMLDWRLSNGVRVLVKPTDFKADEVWLTGFAPGGSSLASDADHLSATLAAQLVSQSGVGDRSFVDLQKELAGRAVLVAPYIGDLEHGITARASPRDLELMFQLIHLYFTAPREDATVYASLRSRLAATLQNRDASPEQAFQDTVQLVLAGYHPRARPVTAGRLDEWVADVSYAFYRERFADAAGFTFVIVGNVEPASLEPLVLTWLGGLPSARGGPGWRDVGMRPPDGVVVKSVRRGLEPRSETRLIFTGPFEYTRENRYALASLRDVLELRLRDVLREDLGGTYGVGVSATSRRDPVPGYTFSVGFGSDPNRLESLVEEVFRQLESIRRDGVDEETLAKVRETQRRSWETNLRENNWWLAQLAGAAQMGTDPRNALTYPDLVTGLTSDRVRDAARAWLRPDRYIRVSLYPEPAGPGASGEGPRR